MPLRIVKKKFMTENMNKLFCKFLDFVLWMTQTFEQHFLSTYGPFKYKTFLVQQMIRCIQITAYHFNCKSQLTARYAMAQGRVVPWVWFTAGQQLNGTSNGTSSEQAIDEKRTIPSEKWKG